MRPFIISANKKMFLQLILTWKAFVLYFTIACLMIEIRRRAGTLVNFLDLKKFKSLLINFSKNNFSENQINATK